MANDKGKVEAKGPDTKGGVKVPPAIPPKGKGVVDKMPEVPVKVVGEAAPPKERKPRATSGGTKYTLLKQFSSEGGAKMPLQSQQILQILAAAPGQSLEKKDLLAEMTKIVATRQPIERILAFYQPRLISGGYFKMEAVVAAAPAAVPNAETTPAADQAKTTAEAPKGKTAEAAK